MINRSDSLLYPISGRVRRVNKHSAIYFSSHISSAQREKNPAVNKENDEVFQNICFSVGKTGKHLPVFKVINVARTQGIDKLDQSKLNSSYHAQLVSGKS